PGGTERLPVQEDAGDTVVLDVVTLGWAEVEELHGAFDPVQAVLGDLDRLHEGRIVGAGPAAVVRDRRHVDDTDVARPVDRVVDVCDLVADQRLTGRTLRAGITLVALLALRPRMTLRAGITLVALLPLRSGLTLLALRPRRTLRAGVTLAALRPRRTLRAGITLVARADDLGQPFGEPMHEGRHLAPGHGI